MRIALIGLLLAGALAQGWIDWQATIGEGYAYRLTPIGAALENMAPEPTHVLLGAIRDSGVPWLWDPVVETIVSLPMALVLLLLAGLLWVTRRRNRGR